MWKPVAINPKYEINESGCVRHRERKTPLKHQVNKYGYETVVLSISHSQRQYPTVHRLIAEAFIPNPEKMPCVNHKDENKRNNSIENLEWCTFEYNSAYGTGRMRSAANRRKPVIARKNGKPVAAYCSVKAAAEALGIDDGNISSALHGRQKTAGGYEWRFK